MFKPNKHYTYSRFSCHPYSGGGVCVYIKSNLESNMTGLSQNCIEKVIDIDAAQIKIGNHLIILLCTYRPPSGNFGEEFLQHFYL